jgi:hypothetical protein
MFEVWEVANGNERSFFQDERAARDKAEWLYNNDLDGIPFVFERKFESCEQIVEFLNNGCNSKVTGS